MAGLAPQNLRQPANDEQSFHGDGITVDVSEAPDTNDLDERGQILRIDHGDGSVTVSLDGRPLNASAEKPASQWYSNLVEEIDSAELSRIADELLRGVDEDLASRQEWVEARATGIKLLGLQIEVPGLQGATDGAPVEGMSKVRHPLLLEAVLRFQANARSELLPTDGPVKVRDDSEGKPPPGMGHNGGPSMTGATFDQDQLADVLEQDMNHYLTAVATEYYPDTDRMLLMLGFGGTSFKKVYFCPLRNRPVSESIDAPDLIVNSAATDLQNAKRITHRTMLRPSTVKRLQILGVYRDIDLNIPLPQKLDASQRQEKEQQGVKPESDRPEDRDREIYEIACELDIKDFEHKHKGQASGLEIPYRVTIDVSSKEILSVVRNYPEDTQKLPEARKTFVKYTFVPGLGFYDIGLLHILGNTTNALTAAWREMLDNGMYANFPGFLMADTGGRQNTNIFRVPPGGGAQVKTGGQDIRTAIMPLPYNTSGQAALQSLAGEMATTGMRIGGTSEQQVGEGRADAPVGTTLAMIEQATKVMNSVHKRLHAAQAEEFSLLKECFKENPGSFVERKCTSGTPWDDAMFLKALESCDLVPQADPNTASHGQRVMKVEALNRWALANPSLADPVAIAKVSITAMGWSNPEQFMAPPAAMSQPPPELQEVQAGIKVAQQTADAKTQEANAKAEIAKAKTAEVQAKAAQGGFAAKPGLGSAEKPPSSIDEATAQAKLMDAETDRKVAGLKAHEVAIEDQNRDLDRQAKTHTELLSLAKEVMMHREDAMASANEAKKINKDLGS